MKKSLYVLAFCTSILLAPSSARASQFSTDESDLWWNPNESGWGMQVVQTGSTLFVTMFVYDQNNNPIWYISTGTWLGNYVWTGDLYQTNGPWFAAMPFNPATVSGAKVGTLTFSAPISVTHATVTYSVNGVVVTKNIQRQTLTYDCFCGTYTGLFKQTVTCTDPSQNGTFDVPVTLVIAHNSGTAFTLVSTGANATCTYTGSYGQDGRLGNVSGGNYSCTDGAAGSFHFFEMQVNATGFTGRGAFQNQSCSATLSFGGIRQ